LQSAFTAVIEFSGDAIDDNFMLFSGDAKSFSEGFADWILVTARLLPQWFRQPLSEA